MFQLYKAWDGNRKGSYCYRLQFRGISPLRSSEKKPVKLASGVLEIVK